MAAQCRKSKRMPPSRAVPCRVMSKSVDNEEHSYVPDTDKIPKFDGVSGCKITAKNRAMGDYRYIYPMLDPDGKTRLVTESDFHHRMRHKYRALEGHSYVYPVLTLGIHEGKRSDLISVNECKETFVPVEVERMIPLGVDLILTDYDDRRLLYIASKRGDIYVADKRKIPCQQRDSDFLEGDQPNVKSVNDVNKEGEPKPTKKQMRDIDRWKKQMEELNRFGNNLSGNRMVYFGAEVNREEWKDDDIMSWFDENYPEDKEETTDDNLCEETVEQFYDETEEPNEEIINEVNERRCIVKSSAESSVDEDDSGYADRRKSSFVSSRMSCESFNSDDPCTEIETRKMVVQDNAEFAAEDVGDVVPVSDGEENKALQMSDTVEVLSTDNEQNNDPVIKAEVDSVVHLVRENGIDVQTSLDSYYKSNYLHSTNEEQSKTYNVSKSDNVSELSDENKDRNQKSILDEQDHSGSKKVLNWSVDDDDKLIKYGDNDISENLLCDTLVFSEMKCDIQEAPEDNQTDLPENTRESHSNSNHKSELEELQTGADTEDSNYIVCDKANDGTKPIITDETLKLFPNEYSLSLSQLSLPQENSKCRQTSESTENGSINDVFYDADELHIPKLDDNVSLDTCSDGYNTPDDENESIIENILQTVRSLPNRDMLIDKELNDRRLWDEVDRSTRKNVADFKGINGKTQIPII